MSQKIKRILDSFSRKELAFFAQYRSKTYSKASREIIQQKLNEENLGQLEIESIIQNTTFLKEVSLSGNQCPRCHSHVDFNRSQGVFESSSWAMLEGDSFRTDMNYETITICMVCGFDKTYGDSSIGYQYQYNRSKKRIATAILDIFKGWFN